MNFSAPEDVSIFVDDETVVATTEFTKCIQLNFPFTFNNRWNFGRLDKPKIIARKKLHLLLLHADKKAAI